MYRIQHQNGQWLDVDGGWTRYAARAATFARYVDAFAARPVGARIIG